MLCLIDKSWDASASEDIDEWDWRSMSEDNDQDDKYCTTSDDDELVTHLPCL